ncbi:MAG: DUF512 domain-containing protein [Lachnospiraceae bacterium]|nr:DUF512 domain-containing protein [Lachnospiraceae bacterium]
MKKNVHVIERVLPGSIAQELELEPGDILLEINNHKIEDIFDYQYYCEDTFLTLLIRKGNGEEWELEIEKDEDEDIGIIFENGLMDDYRSCSNKCIFCFIDQMPKGMRPTLYFKDDDARLSFLQGNYITLTNMSDHDVDRIIRYHLSPINISFQTTNPKLRCEMLNNRFAGEALKKVERFYEAGIEMNGQIVLCKGINDKEELKRTVQDLYQYLPHLKSVSIVPVGLSKYREGLYPLEPFAKSDAVELLDFVQEWQQKAVKEYGLHFLHASDEWYILADRELPQEETYDGYLQLENGVGMVRLMLTEFEDAYSEKEQQIKQEEIRYREETISLITGMLVYPYILEMATKLMELCPSKKIQVIPITNHFFGEKITVTGLLTGHDIVEQCQGKSLGNRLLLPENVLRSGEMILLDDMTVEELKNALQVPVDIVKSSGYDFVDAIFTESEME